MSISLSNRSIWAKYVKIGGIGVSQSPYYSYMGHRTGLKPIGNERKLKNKHPGSVWRAPWEQILSTKFKRPFGPVGVAALRQLRPHQFSIIRGIPRHLVNPAMQNYFFKCVPIHVFKFLFCFTEKCECM